MAPWSGIGAVTALLLPLHGSAPSPAPYKDGCLGTLTLGHPYSSGVVLWSSQSLLTKQLTLTHISARGVV